MTPMALLRSPKTAVVFMSFAVAVLIVFGYRHFGWLGVALVGVLGMVISLRAEIFDDVGDPHERNAHMTVNVYARQLSNRRLDGPEGALRRDSERVRQHVFHRVINTVFAAIIMLGTAMFLIGG